MLKFVTHNDQKIEAEGTCFKGTIKATYTELVQAFGEPHHREGVKSSAEWDIEFDLSDDEDSECAFVVVTIYDWQLVPIAPENISEWHIGGKRGDPVGLVEQALKEVKSE